MAGGVKTFLKFQANAEKYQELCQRYGSEIVHEVIPDWVSLKGGKQITKRNQYACKNFLEDAEGLIEDRKTDGDDPEETDEVARVAPALRTMSEKYAHLVKPS